MGNPISQVDYEAENKDEEDWWEMDYSMAARRSSRASVAKVVAESDIA